MLDKNILQQVRDDFLELCKGQEARDLYVELHADAIVWRSERGLKGAEEEEGEPLYPEAGLAKIFRRARFFPEPRVLSPNYARETRNYFLYIQRQHEEAKKQKPTPLPPLPVLFNLYKL